MVWNDDWFLRRWVGYYGPLIGETNLYIISHGPSETIAGIAPDANIITVPRDPSDIRFDTRRWAFLSLYASALTQYHDAVICLDVDEFLVPSRADLTLPQAVAGMEGAQTRCVAGFELFPRDDVSDAVDTAHRIAPHMAGAQFSPFYSKSGLIFQPVDFFPGAHGMINEVPVLTPDLVLLHLRYANPSELVRRNAVRETLAEKAIDSWDDFMDEGKPFATWRRADKRTRQAFRSFAASRELPWSEMLETANEDLERLRVRRGNVHKFLNKNFEPVRAPLPEWMAPLF